MQPSLIERLFDEAPQHYEEEHHRLFRDFKAALNRGEIRAAEPDASAKAGWRVNAWVKKGILLGFRMGAIADMSIDAAKQPFFDKSTYPVRTFTASDEVRIVPGGSSIRDGTYIGRGVICMPPMFVNVGAYVGEGTMIDSHALVGSCAQVGKSCHISAGAQIGGVLEPAGALPVIVEDEVLVGAGPCLAQVRFSIVRFRSTTWSVKRFTRRRTPSRSPFPKKPSLFQVRARCRILWVRNGACRYRLLSS